MAKNEALFEESSQGAVSAVTAFVFVVSLVLAFGGIYVASFAFDSGITEMAGMWLFGGGLIASVVGFMLPFTFLGATGK